MRLEKRGRLGSIMLRRSNQSNIPLVAPEVKNAERTVQRGTRSDFRRLWKIDPV